MNSIAVLMTCYNRKDKTLTCLRHLIIAYNHKKKFSLSIYLTDDGSTDGTSDAVMQEFSDKDIHILKGTGDLYWAGGMRNSWKKALKGNYDGYLLLNDDTNVYEMLFDELFAMNKYSLDNYHKQGIYCGITCNHNKTNMTYGGSIIKNRFLNTSIRLNPNGTFQECDLGNANIMFVPNDIIKEIGILNENFTHGIADYDYTLNAKRKGIPVLLSSQFCGICETNNINIYNIFKSKNIIGRIKFLYSPLGLAFHDQLFYMRKHFPFRFPIYFIIGLFKTLLPSIYLNLNKRRINKG